MHDPTHTYGERTQRCKFNARTHAMFTHPHEARANTHTPAVPFKHAWWPSTARTPMAQAPSLRPLLLLSLSGGICQQFRYQIRAPICHAASAAPPTHPLRRPPYPHCPLPNSTSFSLLMTGGGASPARGGAARALLRLQRRRHHQRSRHSPRLHT
eukprot:5893246-Pleurochrysis_carterae.AAC.1